MHTFLNVNGAIIALTSNLQALFIEDTCLKIHVSITVKVRSQGDRTITESQIVADDRTIGLLEPIMIV